MSDISSDLQKPRRSRSALIVIAVLTAAVLAVLFEPTGILRGRLLGETFFVNRPTSYWERQLLAGPAERANARALFKEAGPGAVPVLVEMLQTSSSNEVRWTAAEILGELGPDANPASAALLRALRDPDPYVQSVAVEVIPKVGTPAAEAVPALAELLDGEHAPVAARAISVYKAQAATALPQLLDVLTDTSRSTDARWNAARTIGKTGPPAISAVPVLIEMTRDHEGTVRGNAAEAIGDIGPTAVEGIPALIDALSDPVFRVRHHAVRSLAYIGPSAHSAVPQIRKLLDDPEESVQEEARKALAAIAPEEVKSPASLNEDAASD